MRINHGYTLLTVPRLTIDREAGGGASAAVRVRVELAGVARLVLRLDRLDGQLGVVQGSAQADPAPEVLFHSVVAILAVGRHGGGVALLGGLPPQHLLHPLGQAVPAGEGDRLSAYDCLVAKQPHFTWDKGSAAGVKCTMKSEPYRIGTQGAIKKCVCTFNDNNKKVSCLGGLSSPADQTLVSHCMSQCSKTNPLCEPLRLLKIQMSSWIKGQKVKGHVRVAALKMLTEDNMLS